MLHLNFKFLINYAYNLINFITNCAIHSYFPSRVKFSLEKMISCMRKWYPYMVNYRKIWTLSLVREALTAVYKIELKVREKIICRKYSHKNELTMLYFNTHVTNRSIANELLNCIRYVFLHYRIIRPYLGLQHPLSYSF